MLIQNVPDFRETSQLSYYFFRNKVKVTISIFVKFNIKVCSVFTTNKITIIMRFNNNLKVIRN